MKVTSRTALPELLAMLQEHGPEALMAADGIEAVAERLLVGHLTIARSERAIYGNEAAWSAWDALRAEYGDRLRQMHQGFLARILRENDDAVNRATPSGGGSTGEDWFAERGR